MAERIAFNRLRLHGFTAVAELKLGYQNLAILVPQIRLHGFTAVAELKPASPRPSAASGGRGLHGFTAVAELKRRRTVGDRNGSPAVSTASPPWPN